MESSATSPVPFVASDEVSALPELGLDTDTVVRVTSSIPDGLLVVDQHGRIVLANRRAESMFGYDRGELLGHPIEVLVPAKFAGAHVGRRESYEAHPTVRAMGIGLLLFGVRKDGTEVPVDVALSPVRTQTGVQLVVAAVRDDTERRGREAELHRSHVLLDQIGDAVLVVEGPSGRITYANTGAVDLTGYSREELLAGSVDDLLADEESHAGARLASVPPADAVPLRVRTKDGRLVDVEGRTQPLDRSGDVLLEVWRDVTERNRREYELRAAHERLAMADDRERIARDLHDTVIQDVFGTALSLQAIAARVPPEVANRIQELVDRQDRIVHELRTAVFGLTGARRASGTLRDEVLAIVSESTRVLGFRPSVFFEGPVETLSDDRLRVELCASLREALSNVARHAKSQHCQIEMEAREGHLRLTVVDDGVGPQDLTPLGNGLRNLEARAHALGGWCELRPGDSGGASLTWSVPLG